MEKTLLHFCQSCGMPLQSNDDLGTNADNSLNHDYCKYCFQNGAFTRECTIDEMIDFCANFVDQFNQNAGQNLTHEQYAAQLRQFFPHLKRWQN